MKKNISKKQKKIVKQVNKILVKINKFFNKRLISFYRRIDWNKMLFIAIIVLIFSGFFGIWRYSMLSAKGFIKIFPKTAEGNFKNIDKILALENTENSNINSFNKSNSVFPLDFMEENIYSFEVNLKKEDQNIVLPSEEESTTSTSLTTTTTLGTTSVSTNDSSEETTTTTLIDEPETTTTTILEETTTTIPETTTTSTITEETTTTTLIDEPENTTTTEDTTTTTLIDEPETTTTTIPEETTTTLEQVAKIKPIKPILSFIGKYFKNINLLGNIADIVSNTIDTVEQQNTTVTSKEMILSGFVLPELLEDEVLTQFDDEKNNNDILNVKLGISFANKHISTDISSYLDIDIFLNNSWKDLETINLQKEMSNNTYGSYYYINLGNINSVEDIETLKIKMEYITSNLNDQNRIYIDSTWVEIAVNSTLESIINDNTLEIENALNVDIEELYNFDQEVILTVSKEQTKIKKIYKEVLTVEDNIIETNKRTVIIDPTTTVGSSGGGSVEVETDNNATSSEDLDQELDLNKTEEENILDESASDIEEEVDVLETTEEISSEDTLDEEGTSEATESSITEETTTTEESESASEETSTESTESSSEPAPAEASSTEASPTESSESSSEPSSSETSSESSSSESSSSEPTAWVKRFLSYFYKIPKRLIASVEDLIEGEPTTTTIPETTTTIPEEPTTTTESTTTTIADEPETTTTTIPEETATTAGSTPTTSTDEPETTTTLSDISEETTTTLEQSSSGNLNTTTSSQPIRNNNISNPQEKTNPLVVKEEVVPMENFKIRSAILFTPDRKKFRNNISIKENKDSYTITVKHGPELVPGKYDLVIKYFDKDEFYKHTVSFIWGGEVVKDFKITENIKSYFVKDNEDKQTIYLQIKSSENNYYNIRVKDVDVPINTAIGFLENNFMFIDENQNIQGLDILSNSFFSLLLEHDRANYFNLNNKQYLIKIENGIISFIEENN